MINNVVNQEFGRFRKLMIASMTATAFLLPVIPAQKDGRTHHVPLVGLLTGCDENGGGNNSSTREAPSITTEPAEYVEELTDYDGQIIATGTPDPEYNLMTGPSNLNLDLVTGELFRAAVHNTLGSHDVSIDVTNSEGTDSWSGKLNVVYNYMNALMEIQVRGNQYVTAGRFQAFDVNPDTSPSTPVGVNPPKGLDFFGYRVDAVATFPGGAIHPILIDYVGRPDRSQTIDDLNGIFGADYVLDLSKHHSQANLIQQFEDHYNDKGVSPP